ncbi:hypothetical protein QQF64_023769 [Cirrhinus molitorella]|uniref:Uncharacterized protein n=1 Tax=Cirrhinus molitorella TaxID=172907 RepID=A0ABR3NJX1_9TELE
MCSICQVSDDSNQMAQMPLPASDTAPCSADPDQLVEPSGSAEGSTQQQEESVISMKENLWPAAVRERWRKTRRKRSMSTMEKEIGKMRECRKKKEVFAVLQQPRKAKTKVTIFSTLTEGEAVDLAIGFGMALAKHVPKDRLLSGIPEEDIPATLTV